MMRYGRIADINYTNGVAKVALDEVDIITDWATLPKALRSNRIFKIGQQVAVLYDGEDYEILNEVPGGENNQSPSWASNHAEGYEFADGTKIVYDTLTKQLTVTPIESGKVVVAGNAIVSGNQTVMGDLTAGATGIEFTKNFISSINPAMPPTDLNLMSALVVTNLLNLKADKTAVPTSVAELSDAAQYLTTSSASATYATTSHYHVIGDITGLSSALSALVPNSRTVSGLSLSSDISQSALRTALGLGSGAYSSTAYLPLTGGTLTGDLNGTDINLSGGLEARQGAVFAGQYPTFPTGIGTYVANYVSATYGARILAYDGTAYQKLSLGVLSGSNFGLELNTNGTARFLGGVGIGKNLELGALDVLGEEILRGTSAGLYLRNSLGDYASIVGYTGSAYNALDIRAMAGVGNGIYLDTAGNIGFGKIPTSKFDFNGSIYLPNNTGIYTTSTLGVRQSILGFTSHNDLYIGYDTADAGYNTIIKGNNLYFHIGTTDSLGLVILANGCTGLGITPTYAKFQINATSLGTNPLLAFSTIDGTYNPRVIISHITAAQTNGSYLQFDSGYSNTIGYSNWIFLHGKVGIKTPTPEYDLDINGTLGVRGNTNIFQNLYIPNTVYSNQVGIIYKGGVPFIHNFNYGNNGTVTTDGYNTFVGINAGNFTMGATATTPSHASYNSGFGEYTLQNNANGYSNIAVGYAALHENTNGNENTAVGVDALYYNTTGYDNVALGYLAGISASNGSANQTGNNSTFIGYKTKALADGDTNETVIGYDATGVGSNSVMIGNADVTGVYFGGSSHNSNIYAAGGNFSGNVTSSNYISESIGWRITNAGAADFRSVYADSLHAKAFVADISQALAGEDFLTKSVSKLSENFTIPAVGGTATFVVDDLQGFPATRCFVDGDYIRFREIDRSDGALNYGDIWGTIVLDTSYGSSGFLNGRQRYIFTCISNDNLSGYQIGAGAEVLDYGTSGSGVIERTVLDNAGSPYSQIKTWVSNPSISSNYTVWTRLGNLNGVTNCSGYGLYSQNAFLTGSITVGDLTKSSNYLYFSGGTLTLSGTINVISASGYSNFSDKPTSLHDINSSEYTKFTYIDSSGIYTGTVTASQVLATGAFIASNISGLGTLATLNTVSTSLITGLGALATKDNITASYVTDLGALATKSNIDHSYITDIGALATLNNVGLTNLNSTLISGGKIISSLIIANEVLTNALVSGTIVAGTGVIDKLTLTDAVVTGTANIANGYIGNASAGWLIGASYLYNDTYKAGMSPADYPFYAGETYANRATSPFRIEASTGKLTATNAVITGEINASTGTLGILTMNSGGKINIPPTWEGQAGSIDNLGIHLSHKLNEVSQTVEWHDEYGGIIGSIYPRPSTHILAINSEYGIEIGNYGNNEHVYIGSVTYTSGGVTIGNLYNTVDFNSSAIINVKGVTYLPDETYSLSGANATIYTYGRSLIIITSNSSSSSSIYRIYKEDGVNPPNGFDLRIINATDTPFDLRNSSEVSGSNIRTGNETNFTVLKYSIVVMTYYNGNWYCHTDHGQ